jgi:hypothetical protein
VIVHTFEALLSARIEKSWIPAEIPCDDEESSLDIWLQQRLRDRAEAAAAAAAARAAASTFVNCVSATDSAQNPTAVSKPFPSIEPIPSTNVSLPST